MRWNLKKKFKKLYLDENKFEIKETDLENLDDNLLKDRSFRGFERNLLDFWI